MSSLSGLAVLVLLARARLHVVSLPQAPPRPGGYGPVLISVIFSLLLIVSLAIGGSSREEDVRAVLPYVVWIGGGPRASPG